MKTNARFFALAAAILLSACAHTGQTVPDRNADSVPMGPPVVDISKPTPAPGVATKEESVKK